LTSQNIYRDLSLSLIGALFLKLNISLIEQ
jgi:uncharacterized membrane protein